MAWLAIRTFAEGEGIPKIHNHARPVSNVLAGLEPGAPLISRPPAMFGQRTDDAVVPRDVFESLSPDTIVGIDWEFVPEVAEM